MGTDHASGHQATYPRSLSAGGGGAHFEAVEGLIKYWRLRHPCQLPRLVRHLRQLYAQFCSTTTFSARLGLTLEQTRLVAGEGRTICPLTALVKNSPSRQLPESMGLWQIVQGVQTFAVCAQAIIKMTSDDTRTGLRYSESNFISANEQAVAVTHALFPCFTQQLHPKISKTSLEQGLCCD